MAVKTILFIVCFFACCGLALVIPHIGILGYILHYNLGPESQWWMAPISHWPIRYSYTLGLVTAIGMLLSWNKLRFGKKLLLSHEKLLLLFLGLIWVLTLISTETERYTTVDHPSVKITKVFIFTLMMTHVITDIRRLDLVLWALVIGALFLGLEAYDTPRRAFRSGRLESVGGPDFRDANALASYLVTVLPIIGITFLRSKWPGKIVCAASGAFALNAVVLCRSRVSILGLFAAAVVLATQAPKHYRTKIIICLIVAGAGFTYLMDPQFIDRSTTIFEGEETRDASAQSRIDIWKAGIRMIRENPLGVGPGNFYQTIGRYNPQYENRDAHSTYIRCGAELGVPGLLLLLILMANALWMCRKNFQEIKQLPDAYRTHFLWTNCAFISSLMAIFATGLTGTLLYCEAWWWFLLLPVCLRRCLDNRLAEAAAKAKEEPSLPLGLKKRPRKKALKDGRFP